MKEDPLKIVLGEGNYVHKVEFNDDFKVVWSICRAVEKFDEGIPVKEECVGDAVVEIVLENSDITRYKLAEVIDIINKRARELFILDSLELLPIEDEDDGVNIENNLENPIPYDETFKKSNYKEGEESIHLTYHIKPVT